MQLKGKWLVAIVTLALLALSASAQVTNQTFQATAFGRWTVAGYAPSQYQFAPSTCTAVGPVGTFIPFAVGTPFKIVDADPTLNEVVTPSSVTVSGSSCTLSVMPVHQHYSFSLQSATAGLQEAINAAGGQPSVIVVTPDFASRGGTTSTITGATGSAAVSILDARTSTYCSYTWGGSAYASAGCIGSGSGGNGFPITLGNTAIAALSTTPAVTNLTIDGVSPATMAFLDATSSIQTQLNGKQPSGSYLTAPVSLTSQVSGILPVANGGTATATPSLVAGANVTITGSWPNQTVNSTASGSGTVSGQASGVVPLAGGATTINAQSHLNENTSGFDTFTQPVAISDTVDPNFMGFTPNGVAAAVVTGMAGWGLAATLTTPATYLMPDAPGSGLWTASNAGAVVTDTFTPLNGAGAGVPTGPSSTTNGDVVKYSTTTGQQADAGVVAANLVTASSPGVGLAHFAGSTQAVTSSAVNLASVDVTGILPTANGGAGNGSYTLTAFCTGAVSTGSGTTNYLAPAADITTCSGVTSTNINQEVPVPIACTMQSMYVKAAVAGGVAGSGVIFIMKNDVNTALTCTTGTTTTCSDLTHTVSFAAGDSWGISVTSGQASDPLNGIKVSAICK